MRNPGYRDVCGGDRRAEAGARSRRSARQRCRLESWRRSSRYHWLRAGVGVLGVLLLLLLVAGERWLLDATEVGGEGVAQRVRPFQYARRLREHLGRRRDPSDRVQDPELRGRGTSSLRRRQVRPALGVVLHPDRNPVRAQGGPDLSEPARNAYRPEPAANLSEDPPADRTQRAHVNLPPQDKVRLDLVREVDDRRSSGNVRSSECLRLRRGC